MQNDLIVIGATSSLFGAIKPRLIETFKGTVLTILSHEPLSKSLSNIQLEEKQKLKKSLEEHFLVDYYNGTSEGLIKCIQNVLDSDKSSKFKVLYLSTSIDVNVLQFLNNRSIPSLQIGSGAETDWAMNRKGFSLKELYGNSKTETFANYIETKALAARNGHLTINPGFYLNGEMCEWTGSGLHLESSEKIFAGDFDDTFNWGKEKFVTSLPSLADFIVKWATSNEWDNIKGTYSFGSNRAFTRWELREMSGFDDVSDEVKQTYPKNGDDTYKQVMDTTKRTFSFDFPDDYTNVQIACKSSRKWVEDNEDNYKRLKTNKY